MRTLLKGVKNVAKYQAMPRRESQEVIANANGVTFGKMIKELREGCNLSLRGACAEIGISPAYLSDLENDRRYPPVGEVLKSVLKTYRVNVETECEIMELIGLGRKELAPDMAEFMRKNQFARSIARKLMQVDNLDALVVDNEEESLAIITAVENLLSKGKVKPLTDDVEN